MQYPMVERLIAALDPPFLQGAEVEFTPVKYRDEHSGDWSWEIPGDKADLVLPDVSKSEFERLPKELDIEVSQLYEDDQGMSPTFTFKFHVQITGSEQLADGEVSLKYEAQLIEYEVAA